MDLGQKIKALREERGISQEALAEALDVSRQAVTKWESGASRPSTGNLLALCRVLEVPLETFTTGDVPKTTEKKETAETSQKGRFPLWIVCAVGILCIGLAIVGACMGKNEFPTGAIGGADGPTAIFVTTAVDWSLVWIFAIAGALLLGIGIVLMVKRKK